VAAASVTWMIVHMWRFGRRMKRDIEGRLQSTTVRQGAAAFSGVLLFTLLMVTREGMETSLLLMQLHETLPLVIGAAGGVLGAAGVAWLWSRYGHRINLSLFFQVTAIFLFVFVVQLVIQGTHEMAEQNYLPYSEIIHTGTEAWGPDSAFGHVLTYLLVILPLGWLLAKAVFSKRPVLQRDQTANDRGSDLDRRSQILNDSQQGVAHAR
jgi:high-affinity iron transporter